MASFVLVDTPIWSLALRRREGTLNPTERRNSDALARLIREGQAQIVGPIRQELLSGIKEYAQFRKIRQHLRAFDNPSLELGDYEEAAEMFNKCRARGITGSAVDFLLCAVVHRRGWALFTTDLDFQAYATILSLSIYSPA